MKWQSGKIKPHLDLLKQIKEFVASFLELVPLRKMGFDKPHVLLLFFQGEKELRKTILYS